MSKRVSKAGGKRIPGVKHSKTAWKPDLAQWRKGAAIFPTNRGFHKYLGISSETYYAFIDKENKKVEDGLGSVYLDTLNSERRKLCETVSKSLLRNVESGDASTVIFASKVICGYQEQKDIDLYNLKKKEIELKTTQYLERIAEKFNLTKEELFKFHEDYFKAEREIL